MEINIRNFIKEQISLIKNLVKEKKVICAVSGGIDSMTTALLCQKAVGRNLTAVFIDDGLMREKEGDYVIKELKKHKIKVKKVERQERFFSVLKGLTDPEEKRKAFRDTFYNVLSEIVKEENAQFLAQGTIKADIIETKRGIKTQHNVLEQIGIDVNQLGLQLIEPLKTLLKPQVRKVAKTLGLSKLVFERKPFPGPGLLCRVLGEVTEERVAIIKKATKIVEELTRDIKSFQTFPVLLSDKATGIKNKKRVLGDIIALRCVESKDALTAKPKKLSYELLFKISERLTRLIPSCVKVVYDITPKPPSTIEYI